MHVRVYRPEEVTSANTVVEAEPGSVDLSRADVDAMWASIVSLYETGLHPAIALCVRRKGRVVIDRAIGHLRGNAPGVPAETPKIPIRYDSLFNMFSASKAVTAMVVHLLDQRGLVHLDDEIAHHIPEFGRHGKESMTIRQVLTHRAGIPAVPGTRIDLDVILDPDRVLALLCDARPLSVPGRRLAYHALTGGFIFGEVVRRVTGRDIRQYLREEVLDPLGFKNFDYGIVPSRVLDVAQNAMSGLPPVPPPSWLLKRSLGVTVAEAVELSNDPRYLTGIVPSGNIVGTANEASRFFQLLLEGGELDGIRVFDRRTVRRAVAEQSFIEIDSFLGLPVRYSMGFMLGRSSFSPYGANSEQAFGHVGFSSVIAYADPERALSVGLMTSGKPFVTPGQLRWLQVMRVIAERCSR